MEGTTLGIQNSTEDTAYYPDYNFSDYTDHVIYPRKRNLSNIVKICIFFVIFITGFIGNGLVIFVTGFKMKTTVNSIWFLNLAIADFIFIVFLVRNIVVLFHNPTWTLSNFICKFLHFVPELNSFASVFFLTVISLDRCLCSWVVVWAQNKRTLVKARIICVFVWSLSICCSIPYAIVYSGFKYCVFSSSMNVLMYLYTYRCIVGFLIPFFIIASSNIAIGVRVKRFKRSKQLRPFRVIIAVILAFFICWFPYHVQKLLYVIEYNWSIVVQEIVAAETFVKCLSYLNSCLNPILYVFMCEEYKKKLKKSLLVVLEGAFREDHLGLPSASRSQEVSSRPTDDITTSFSARGQENKHVFCL